MKNFLLGIFLVPSMVTDHLGVIIPIAFVITAVLAGKWLKSKREKLERELDETENFYNN
jgi:hypothetical protein